MAKKVRISLALKCQLLFGAAVVLIVASALVVGWLRMKTLVTEGHEETARRLANAWIAKQIYSPEVLTPKMADPPTALDLGLTITDIDKADFEKRMKDDAFLRGAIGRFRNRPNQSEWFRQTEDLLGNRYFRYAQAVRAVEDAHPEVPKTKGKSDDTPHSLASPLQRVVLVELRADLAVKQLALNRVYIILAGLLAGLVAIGTFWYITTRVILKPVRLLREVAEKVSEGDLNIRSDINTGDEYEQLSEMFNTMLANIKDQQDQLESVNKSLDLKLDELARSNVALYEANKIKGEFLANVSHELRTPLNSMIGFAEVLQETLQHRTGPVDEKRKRYISNIIIASRRLLDMINELLDLAKIEAGRMELAIGAMNVADTAEGLIHLMRPQAEKRKLEMQLNIEKNLPIVHTDAGKFQQIIFNFLSNAVKFTPEQGRVELSAARESPSAEGDTTVETRTDHQGYLRVSVSDTGPGIPLDMHERVFEKFTQLDQGVTRQHLGTGLGLTISKELAKLLQGRLELDSDTGRGATFSLIIPFVLEPQGAPLMPQDDDDATKHPETFVSGESKTVPSSS